MFTQLSPHSQVPPMPQYLVCFLPVQLRALSLITAHLLAEQCSPSPLLLLTLKMLWEVLVSESLAYSTP